MKISEALNKAADHIETYGWHQGYFWPGYDIWGEPPYVEGNPCCALGAIAVVEEVDPTVENTAAMEYLAEHLGYKTANYIPDWNDHGSRTKEEVLAALRGAATRAERAGK